MNRIPGTYMRALRAEWLKLKRTGVLWICLGSAAFIPVINTIAYFFIEISNREQHDNSWQRFVENNFRGFTGFFFPLFLILMVTRIVYIEHRSDTWKLLETQPVHRISIFLSKWTIAVLVSLICLLALFAFASIGGYLLIQFRLGKNFQDNFIEWGKDFRLISRIWVASMGLISVQYFLSLLIKSFAWPVIIGLVAIIAGSILTNFGIFNWFPYVGPLLTTSFLKGSNTGSFFIPHEILSIAWSVLFLWLAYQFFRRKKFTTAYFRPLSRLASTLAVLVAFGFLFWFINKPVHLNPYGKTVLAGTIHSDIPIENLVLYKLPAYDTLLMVAVKNGKFHSTIDKDLQPLIYTARAGSRQLQLYFGRGDSVYLDWSIADKSRIQYTVTGTRTAENAYLSERSYDYEFEMLKDYAYQYNPRQFSNAIESKWKSGQRKLDNFKTVDNIKPAKDFLELQKKFLAIDLLTLTEVDYPRVLAVYFPNDTAKSLTGLMELKEKVSFNDDNLAVYPQYRQYVTAVLQRKAFSTERSYLSVVANEVPSEKLRNFLAFDEIQKNLSTIHDSLRREMMLMAAISILTEANLRIQLVEMNNRMNKLQRGKKAPAFVAEGLNGNEYSLDQLSKRYLIIDVWATWCGPCKKESPYFEQLAEQYTDERIAFVSISVDQDKNAWRMEAPQKSRRVMQLWVRNAEADFMKAYSLATIPRFILIDPKGNILNAQLPYPSDPQFEIELQKEIPSLRLTAY